MFGGLLMLHHTQEGPELIVTNSDEDGNRLWQAPLESFTGARLLHCLPSNVVQFLCSQMGYNARVSASADLSAAQLTGPNTIYPAKMYQFGFTTTPTRENDAAFAVLVRRLREQAARGVRGVVPARWIKKLPATRTIGPGLVYQGPVWARKSWYGPAHTIDQRKAYLSCAAQLGGQRVWAGLWRWRPEGAVVGVLPVHLQGNSTRFPARGDWRIAAVISQEALEAANSWGRLELLECDVSEVFPAFDAEAATQRLDPVLAKACYVQWWGAMVASSAKRYGVGSRPGDKRDGTGLSWSGQLTSGTRRLWGAAISWTTAVRTGALAASYGARALACHIDSVIVQGREERAAIEGWTVKERGIVRLTGPGCWTWYKDGPPYEDAEGYDNPARWRAIFKQARMLSEDDATKARLSQFTTNGDPLED